MSYISEEKIWEQVKNTEIHNIFKDGIEFVLSVHICKYPHYIMSVWVYIAVLYK
jgi:coiled-coil and C2 domain-containing protein 2A